MKRARLGAIAIAILLVLILTIPLVGQERPPTSSTLPGGSVVFAAGGDHMNNTIFQAGLGRLESAGLDFYVALGDLGFTSVGKEWKWCANIRAKLGSSFPFQLISGNHDQDGAPEGWIGNYVQGCPDHMGSVGVYGAQYYFDYPSANPLVRVILLTPDITAFGTFRDYTVGSPEYVWATSTIDDARAKGISWVVVGMHRVCINTGDKTCEVGTDLYDLLMDKRVDLIIHGHTHTNERSKQLTCAVPHATDLGCVVDDGFDDLYSKGKGPIVIIGGPMGQEARSVDPTDSEAGYFAKIGGETYGFYRYTLTADRIDAMYVAVQGSFADSFSIVATPPGI